MNSRAQGTIEYLVVIAIIVVISLAVIGLLTNSIGGSAATTSITSSKIASMTGDILVSELEVTPDGNYLARLENNTFDTITITTIKVGDTNNSFSSSLYKGSAQNFVLTTSDVCTLGQSIPKRVTIYYTTAEGLTKTYSVPVDVYFNCDNYVSVSAVVSGTSAAGTPLELAHYLMNDNAASTAVADVSGNSFAGTAQQNTSALTTAGKISSALTFNGSSDYIDSGNAFGTLQDFSVSIWFNATSNPAVAGLVSNGGAGTYHTMYLASNHVSYGGLYFAIFDDTNTERYLNPSIVPSTGEWHHIVIVKNSTTMSMYYDNQLVDSGSISSTIATPTNNLKVGTDGYGNYFAGSIDDVRIYDYAITTSDINFLYNPTGIGLDEVMHYRLNENAETTTVVDLSENGYTGTATANTNTLSVAGKINNALNFAGAFSCTGTETSCDIANFPTTAQCSAQSGCSPTSSGDCSIANYPDCLGYEGCSDNSQVSCSGFYYSSCDGTATSCGTFLDSGTCGAQSGCGWTGGASGNYVTIPNTGVPTGSNPIALSAWINLASTTSPMGVVGIGSTSCDSDNVHLALFISAGNYVIAHHGGGYDWDTGQAVSTGEWHLLSYDANGNWERAWFDGTLVGERTQTSAIASNPSSRIGSWDDACGNNYFLDGIVDDVRIYDSNLSQTSVDTIYNSGTGTEISLGVVPCSGTETGIVT